MCEGDVVVVIADAVPRLLTSINDMTVRPMFIVIFALVDTVNIITVILCFLFLMDLV
jgi:hypothetical protein